jgi:hypothetical protein
MPSGEGMPMSWVSLGITVNAIAPTVVKIDDFIGRNPRDGAAADELMGRIVSLQTIKCPCTPTDGANVLAFPV